MYIIIAFDWNQIMSSIFHMFNKYTPKNVFGVHKYMQVYKENISKYFGCHNPQGFFLKLYLILWSKGETLSI